MEPRVVNLLLKDDSIGDDTENAETSMMLRNVLPSIQLLNVDETGISSLPLNQNKTFEPSTSSISLNTNDIFTPGGNVLLPFFIGTDVVGEECIDPRMIQTSKLPAFESDHPVGNEESHANTINSTTVRGTKSAAPLAGVLNSNSPHTRALEDTRKRRRANTRLLPELPSAKSNAKAKRFKALLPPLLAPLYEPPPERGPKIVPSIDTTNFADPRIDWGAYTTIEQPRAVSPENETAAPISHDIGGSEKKRRKWTDAETEHLLRGVSKHGIGSWKKILTDDEFKFDSRSAVDLKDRFRTCCPPKNRATKNGTDAIVSSQSDGLPTAISKRPAKISKENPTPKQSISEPSYTSSNRRQRRDFTPAEDEALLRGFTKYQGQWKKIRIDPLLNLSSRSRTDLRDRFRNRYPTEFSKAGYTTKQSASKPTIPTSEPTQEDSRSTQHTMKLLTASYTDNTSAPPMIYSPVEDEYDTDPANITLSRNIFAWADQNSRSVEVVENTVPRTLSRLDHIQLNPLAASVSTKGSVPLSGILNEVRSPREGS